MKRAVTLLTLLALLLRLKFIGGPARFDESMSLLRFVNHGLFAIVTDYSAPNNHVLHTLLMWLSVRMFGDAEWALRIPALIFGGAMIPLTAWASELLFRSRIAALSAAALVACSSFLIEYSTNGRGYTMQGCFAPLLLIVNTKLRDEDSKGLWIANSLLTAASLWTIPTSLYPIGAIALWVAVGGIRVTRDSCGLTAAQKQWWTHFVVSIAGGGLLAVLLYLPIIRHSGLKSLTANDFVLPLSLHEFLHGIPRMLWGTFRLWNRDIPWVLIVPLVIGVVLSVRIDPADRKGVRFSKPPPLLLATTAAAILLLIYSRRIPPFRVWMPFTAWYWVLATAGLRWAVIRLEWDKRLPARSFQALEYAVPGALAVTLSVAFLLGPGVRLGPGSQDVVLVGANEIAAKYGQLRQPGDRIYCAHPSELSMEYAMYRAKLPDNERETDLSSRPRRTFVVVNSFYTTLDERIREGKLDRPEYQKPKPVLILPHASLYVCELSDSGPSAQKIDATRLGPPQ